MKGVPIWFIALWCVLMPLTSLLVIPSVQGTIPAYILGFSSVIFVILSRGDGQPSIQRRGYFTVAIVVAGIWILLLCGSQLGHLLSNRHSFGELLLNNPSDSRVVLRSVLFTQSLYLAACLCIALFFRFFFRDEWMRYVLWGAWFLAIYGIYEWLFFFVFQQPGDFLANRTYGEEMHTGSWSQGILVGPFSLLRIKSTYGEPSFFSAAVLPYLFLALEYKRKWLSAALFFCLVFSTSTSAYAALPFAVLSYGFFRKKLTLPVILMIFLFVAAIATLYLAFPETFDSMFTAKLNAKLHTGFGSGAVRQESQVETEDATQSFTLMNRIFGIGFGYSYAGVFHSIMINTGWIGLLIYCYAFLKPAILLRPEGAGIALKVGVLTLFFLFYIDVAELFLPTTWMFLGLAYWRLDQQRREKESTQVRKLWAPVQVGQG
jgi:hypothetical protein